MTKLNWKPNKKQQEFLDYKGELLLHGAKMYICGTCGTKTNSTKIRNGNIVCRKCAS